MKQNSKLIIILNLIIFVEGVVSLILFINAGVDFQNPIMWILCSLVLSSISFLIVQFINKNKK